MTYLPTIFGCMLGMYPLFLWWQQTGCNSHVYLFFRTREGRQSGHRWKTAIYLLVHSRNRFPQTISLLLSVSFLSISSHYSLALSLSSSSSFFSFSVSHLKIENYTILIPKGNSYCRRKSSAREPQFKVSSGGLSRESDILIRLLIKVSTEVDVA